MKAAPVITIDGPSASGKTTVSRLLARRLGWRWVSTGAFYRALAYAAQSKNVPLDDENAVAQLAQEGSWSVRMGDEQSSAWLGTEEVTSKIFSENIGILASQISQFPKVRKALLNLQRNCAQGVPGLVAEGRDCGSVVFPQALLKVYLEATSQARIARRVIQEKSSIEEVKKSQTDRDHRDTHRKAAPLQVPVDGVVVDTDQRSIEEVVNQILDLYQAKRAGHL